jgi:hypothetical protein
MYNTYIARMQYGLMMKDVHKPAFKCRVADRINTQKNGMKRTLGREGMDEVVYEYTVSCRLGSQKLPACLGQQASIKVMWIVGANLPSF